MFKKILTPIDGGDLSNNAVIKACEFAKPLGAQLIFYHAQPIFLPEYLSGEVIMGVVGSQIEFINAMHKQAEEILNQAAQTASRLGVEFETLTDESYAPYEGIIAAAERMGCDLIFMASHGRHGVSALLLGSETQKVLPHCKIPVLVYR
jgi:nucleotide-binding universal stress UspA family protein